jgi:hypothetical protein
MLICKIIPSAITCDSCSSYKIDKYGFCDCSDCPYAIQEHEVLKLGKGLFSAYAMVLVDGRIEKMPLNRLHSVRRIVDTDDSKKKNSIGFGSDEV